MNDATDANDGNDAPHDRAPRPCLRDAREHLATDTVLVSIAAISTVLAISGPFGTRELLPLGGRFAYWTSIAILTYALGTTLWCLLSPHLARAHGVVRIVVSALLAGVGVNLLVAAANALVFGAPFQGAAHWSVRWAEVTAITLAVGAAQELLTAQSAPATERAPLAPPLIDRLPAGKRGPLVSISVQDHYVEVVTTQGRQILLMRLSDAIRETEPTPGLQVHRSHWVATEQVATVVRAGDRARIKTVSGDDLPVSRSYIDAVRDAGLLPAKGRVKGRAA